MRFYASWWPRSEWANLPRVILREDAKSRSRKTENAIKVSPDDLSKSISIHYGNFLRRCCFRVGGISQRGLRKRMRTELITTYANNKHRLELKVSIQIEPVCYVCSEHFLVFCCRRVAMTIFFGRDRSGSVFATSRAFQNDRIRSESSLTCVCN